MYTRVFWWYDRIVDDTVWKKLMKNGNMECNFFIRGLFIFEQKKKKIELENPSLTHIPFEIYPETSV